MNNSISQVNPNFYGSFNLSKTTEKLPQTNILNRAGNLKNSLLFLGMLGLAMLFSNCTHKDNTLKIPQTEEEALEQRNKVIDDYNSTHPFNPNPALENVSQEITQ